METPKMSFWYDRTRGTFRMKGGPKKKCLAKTRRGTLCQRWAMLFKDRCHMHGGKSTGPKTERGKERSSLGRKMRGKKAIEEWRAEFERSFREIWERWYWMIPLEDQLPRPWEWWDKWGELWREFKLESPCDVANRIFEELQKEWRIFHKHDKP